MVTINEPIKYDNCKNCVARCEHAGKDREFVCMGGKSCKVTGEEKTYSALIERLKLSYNWHSTMAASMERQPDLNDYEKRYIIEQKAIAAQLAKIIEHEAGEKV